VAVAEDFPFVLGSSTGDRFETRPRRVGSVGEDVSSLWLIGRARFFEDGSGSEVLLLLFAEVVLAAVVCVVVVLVWFGLLRAARKWRTDAGGGGGHVVELELEEEGGEGLNFFLDGVDTDDNVLSLLRDRSDLVRTAPVE